MAPDDPGGSVHRRPAPRAAALLALTGAAAGLGPAALHWLAGFGQEPPDRLPLAAILLLGAVLSGPLTDLTTSLERGRALGWLGLALLLGLGAAAATLPLPSAGAAYLLCPVAAVSLAAALREARPPGLAQAVVVYVACTLLANFTLDSFLPLGGFFLVNVGTFFFGVTFTQRDRVHRFGRTTVYRMILLAAVMNVVLSATLGTPLRYVAVSFLSILLAETADTEVFHRLRGRGWLTRVAGSNAVSAPLDTVAFTVLAFWGEEFATPVWMTRVIVTDVLVKYASGLVAALGILALVRSTLPAPPLAGDRAADEAGTEPASASGGGDPL